MWLHGACTPQGDAMSRADEQLQKQFGVTPTEFAQQNKQRMADS
ncbi:hypothetical protein [Bacteroides sp. HF-5092]|nr:hypothetical protein [Bacteroides sp. HF-5092]